MILLLTLALSAPSFAADTPCGTPDCSVVADVSMVADTGQVAKPAAAGPWAKHTKLNPDSFKATGLSPEVFKLALTAWANAYAAGDTNKKILTVIDYSQHSSKKRMWVIDLESGKLLFNDYVAHGKHSGDAVGEKFSNVPESNKSSVGLVKTAETYQSGKFGYALRLDGMEQNVNHNIRDRAIVMHKSEYVRASYIKRNGRAGRSLGCTAIDPAIYRDVIDTIKGGSLMFLYGQDANWLRSSKYLGDAGVAHADQLKLMASYPTIKRGASGDAVKTLQEALIKAGYLQGTADGDFGRGTKKALQDFQRDSGLTADGVAGKKTWDALLSAASSAQPATTDTATDASTAPATAAPPPQGATDRAPRTSPRPRARPKMVERADVSGLPTLRKGMQGSEVSTLQQALKDSGFYSGRVDGDFGWRTRNAVKAYQRANGLSADGVVGTRTWDLIVNGAL